MSALAFKVSEVLSAGWKGLKIIFYYDRAYFNFFRRKFYFRALIGDLPFVIFILSTLFSVAYIMLSIVKACLKIVKGENQAGMS